MVLEQFFHMDALGYVLPYPSTFTAALIFFSFALYIHVLKGAHSMVVALFSSHPMLLLTLPTTAMVFCAGAWRGHHRIQEVTLT